MTKPLAPNKVTTATQVPDDIFERINAMLMERWDNKFVEFESWEITQGMTHYCSMFFDSRREEVLDLYRELGWIITTIAYTREDDSRYFGITFTKE